MEWHEFNLVSKRKWHTQILYRIFDGDVEVQNRKVNKRTYVQRT